MADSTNPYDIPVNQFNLVAGYVDGAYAWSADGWNHHAQVTHVRIACFASTFDADVLDVESGCSSPQEAAQWLRAHVDRGQWKVLYFSSGLFGAVHAAVLAAGVDDTQWGQWAAQWDNRPVLDVGSVAKQYANPTLSGGHYDLSVVVDYWAGVDPLPATPARGAAPGSIVGWAGLAGKVDFDLPAFGHELGVLSSAIDGIG